MAIAARRSQEDDGETLQNLRFSRMALVFVFAVLGLAALYFGMLFLIAGHGATGG